MGISSFINSHIALVYLVYAGAFLFSGLALQLQAKEGHLLRFDDHLWLIKIFALTHALKEMCDWYLLTYGENNTLSWIGNLFMVASFVALLEFGRRLLLSYAPQSIENSPWLKTLLGFPLVVALTALVTGIAVFAENHQVALDIGSRYFLGLPGSIVVSYALVQSVGRGADAQKLGLANTVKWSAACFFIYAIVGGLVVKGDPALPSFLPTYSSFQDAFGVPVQLIRALCALGIAISFSGIIEAINTEWRRLLAESKNTAIEQAKRLEAEIVEHKRADEELKLASMIYQNSSEAMMVTDANDTILNVNPAFTVSTGYMPEEVIGKNPRILSSGRNDAAFYQTMWHEINTTGTWRGEIWNKRKNGEIYPEWLTVNTICNENGLVYRRIALFTDITEKKKSEELIWQQANFDTLTGLPNRRMCLDRLEQEIRKAHRAGQPLAVMFIDLDHFKEVNDTLGHGMGDLLLQEAAKRLTGCVRASDTVARFGGDEFTILLSELDDPGSADRVAECILRSMIEPFRLGENLAYVSASIGITLYSEDATDTETLLKNADQAMYAAKQQGRNRFSYFTPFMQEAAQIRMQLANDLRGALASNQFVVHYQPIVELATGAINKAEALVRWQHPAQGLIGPAAFIPIAEEAGMIADIGEWVFRESARQAGRWRTSRHPAFQISVNKSPAQFRENKNHTDWFNYLQELKLPGQSIVVEITEGLLVDAGISDKLLAFRDAGIEVSLDDFGTGYSSLSYLKKFHIDYLKIDKSFVQNLAPGSDDMALCEAIIVMAHKLGIQVVAEGIETEQQRDLLTAAGCDFGQGYLWSRPVPPEEFEKLLAAS